MYVCKISKMTLIKFFNVFVNYFTPSIIDINPETKHHRHVLVFSIHRYLSNVVTEVQ